MNLLHRTTGRGRRILDDASQEAAILGNYFKIAFRNLRRHTSYSLINIGGLALGMATCFVILLFIRYELSYDEFHQNAERIHRVTQYAATGDLVEERLIHPAPLAPALLRDVRGVDQAVRLRSGGEVLVKREGESFYEDGFFFTDASFFSVFTSPLLRGDPLSALERPFTVVITESTAEKYFGDENPIGRTINIGGLWGARDYEVTGLVRDFPPNSHFHFRFLTSLETLRSTMPDPEDMESWFHTAYYTYVLLSEGTSAEDLRSDLERAMAVYHPNVDFEERGIEAAYRLQPITDIHLHSHLERELEANGDERYLYIFSALALLILLVACINYMNLATARSARRAREVGVRKVVGAYRTQLIRQFLSQSLVFGGLALVLAFVLLLGLIPLFNQLSGKPLEAAHIGDGGLAIGLAAAGILVALMAGLYPALFLSRFQPVRVLRGLLGLGAGSKRLRSGLVVVQFAISFALICGTLVIQRQLEFMQEKKLGLNQDRVVVINTHGALGRRLAAFRTELLQNPDILSVTASDLSLPVRGRASKLRPEGFDDMDVFATHLSVGPHFLKTLEIELLEGSDLPDDYQPAERDHTPTLINEAAARAFGWEDPIGKTFSCCFGPTPKVIGVVRDFHFRSVTEAITPLAITPTWWSRHVLVRFRGDDVRTVVGQIERTWTAFASDKPFEYNFLDAQFDETYRAEEQLAGAFGGFSALAILIACMGLFGLAAFMAEKRTKEIGIRKSLGATAANIVLLLSREFMLLVAAALLIGTPLVYVAAHHWLEEFAYRSSIGPGVFLLAGLSALLIAMLTVSYQAVKAALTNPAKSLRYE